VKRSFTRASPDIEGLKLRIHDVEDTSFNGSQNDGGGFSKSEIIASLWKADNVDVLQLAVECLQLEFRAMGSLAGKPIDEHFVLQS
jgi:hypothetical protein